MQDVGGEILDADSLELVVAARAEITTVDV